MNVRVVVAVLAVVIVSAIVAVTAQATPTDTRPVASGTLSTDDGWQQCHTTVDDPWSDLSTDWVGGHAAISCTLCNCWPIRLSVYLEEWDNLLGDYETVGYNQYEEDPPYDRPISMFADDPCSRSGHGEYRTVAYGGWWHDGYWDEEGQLQVSNVTWDC